MPARIPFQSRLSQPSAPVTVTGAVPGWLQGLLARAAPAVFETEGWASAHWFDGLGMLYAFEVGAGGAMQFRQRQLDSEVKQHPARSASFATTMKRSFWQRLFEPIPRSPDNTNVNVLPFGDELVALTETSRQWVIDPLTLKGVRHLAWTDEAKTMQLLAHPHLDAERGVVVNVGTTFGRKPTLSIVEHAPASRARKVVATWEFTRVPYVHSFGLTPKHAIVLAHPFDVKPWSMLWSNEGYITHFAWRPEAGTRLGVFDRATGARREHTAPPLFVFHTVNAFEDGDVTVLDVIAYDDAAIVKRLSMDAVLGDFPEVRSRLLRLRMTPGQEAATVTPLTDEAFEFPAISYRRHAGRDYGVVFGTALRRDRGALRSRVVRVELKTGEPRHFEDDDFIFGEPVFVPHPQARTETAGVLLTVGSHAVEPRACLQVLDAESLQPLARGVIELPLPLGFHGSFLPSAAQGS